MGSAPAEPSSSVATGGSDETGGSGKGTSGTCHVCGGALRRGNVNLARQCPVCKTRFHASDCGKRRSNAGYAKPYDACPKCAAQCKCVGGETMCHTNTVRVSRIRKRVAACGERMDPDGGSTGTRRTGDVVWVRRLSASDPGLGGELTVDSSRRESAMRAGGSFQDALNDPGLMCQLLPEHSEPEPGGGASMAAFAAAPAGGERVHARGDADGRHPAIRDSPEFALPTDDLYDWSDVLVRIAAEEVGNGNFDETRFPNSVADDSAAPRRGDGRFGGSTPHLDATAGTPSPPFGARAPAFPGVPVYGQGGDGDGGFTLKHARYMQSAFEVLSDEEGSP